MHGSPPNVTKKARNDLVVSNVSLDMRRWHFNSTSDFVTCKEDVLFWAIVSCGRADQVLTIAVFLR